MKILMIIAGMAVYLALLFVIANHRHKSHTRGDSNEQYSANSDPAVLLYISAGAAALLYLMFFRG